jgi:hypothetical protein
VIRIPLAACPGCARHVRVSEPACPFCRAELPSSFRKVRAPPSPVKRLSRAALYALRMGALSATAAACGGQSLSPAEGDRDSGPTSSGPVATYGGVDGSYGGPPPDASGNSSGQDDSPSLLAYGAPPNPADADVTLDDDGDDGPPPR